MLILIFEFFEILILRFFEHLRTCFEHLRSWFQTPAAPGDQAKSKKNNFENMKTPRKFRNLFFSGFGNLEFSNFWTPGDQPKSMKNKFEKIKIFMEISDIFGFSNFGFSNFWTLADLF